MLKKEYKKKIQYQFNQEEIEIIIIIVIMIIYQKKVMEQVIEV